MENEDIIDYLFNKQDEDCIFNLKDNLLEELNKKLEMYNNKMGFFINKRIHPNNKAILKDLMRKIKSTKNEYHHRENQLYYKNGVADGMNLIVTLLSFK